MSGWVAWFALMAYAGVGMFFYSVFHDQPKTEEERNGLLGCMVFFWPAAAIVLALTWVKLRWLAARKEQGESGGG